SSIRARSTTSSILHARAASWRSCSVRSRRARAGRHRCPVVHRRRRRSPFPCTCVDPTHRPPIHHDQNMRMSLLALLAAAPLAAQSASKASAVADAQANWASVRDYLVQSAVDMPEAKYSYRPTASVRTFGEILAHVAGSQSMFCAIALGEKPAAED